MAIGGSWYDRGPGNPALSSSPWLSGSGMETGGLILGWAGAATSAIGAWYALDAKKAELDSQASAAEFEGSMSQRNARQAEEDAQSITEAAKSQKGEITWRYGQERANLEASQAARGGLVGAGGSNAEALASEKLVRDIDVYNLESNAVRSAAASRRQAVNFRNRARFAGVSAENLRASRRTIKPGLGALASLAGGAGENLYATSRSSRDY